ncbi:MAG: WbqC family protein [Flavobacteriales bacterium]
MILAVHQPNFLPWVGYFSKLAASDSFVLLDEVQFPRGKSPANRAIVQGPNGPTELVLPVSIPKGREGKASYREVGISEGKWRKKFLKTLEMGYKKTPYFEEHFPFIKELLGMRDLCEMNIAFVRYVVQELGLETELSLLSEHRGIRDEKLDRIFDLCHSKGAEVYLSGKGAAKYNDPVRFEAAGISLYYTEKPVFEEPVMQESVEHGMSVLDPLFRLGKGRCAELFRDGTAIRFSKA